MDAATIAGCRAKINRAEAAIQEMTAEWSTWLDTNPYPSRIDVDRQTGEHRLCFDLSIPTPMAFGVWIGEIAHDLRSALDHLVWREAIELLGCEPTDQQAREIAFPIWRTRIDFKKSKVQRYVSPDAWTIIERYQPYVRSKPKRSRTLAVLHEINRIDKHRTLNIGVAWAPTLIEPLKLIERNPDAWIIGVSVGMTARRLHKRNAEIACYTFDPEGPESQMRVKGTPPFNISFGDLPSKLGSASITETVAEVRRVIDDFANLGPPSS